jgi:hypothetical protein
MRSLVWYLFAGPRGQLAWKPAGPSPTAARPGADPISFTATARGSTLSGARRWVRCSLPARAAPRC